MTNERAIELLNRISDSQFDGIHGDERREALEMAVMALEQNLVQESGGLVQDLVKDCISRQQAIEPESISEWKKDFREYVDSLDIARDDWKGIIEYIEELPSAQPETHDKRTETHACDLINRQQAIDAVKDLPNCRNGFSDTYDKACIIGVLEDLPTAQPQCKKGKWIKLDMHAHIADHKCTACGQECYVPTCMGEPMYNYCPSCGADMRGDDE